MTTDIVENDKLDKIFIMQKRLMDRYGYKEFSGDKSSVLYLEWMYKHVNDLCTCISQESAELRDWLPWKHWSTRLGNKSSVVPGSEEHLRELDMEIIDIFHFTLELCIVRGITPDRLFDVYAEKNAINHDRQNAGGY